LSGIDLPMFRRTSIDSQLVAANLMADLCTAGTG
jgi:hypothetical protein